MKQGKNCYSSQFVVKTSIIFFTLSLVVFVHSQGLSASKISWPKRHPAKGELIQGDLEKILTKAGLPSTLIRFRYRKANHKPLLSLAKVKCQRGGLTISIHSKALEWSSTFYYALHKLGFLFPHPRLQISPSQQEIRKHCGKKYVWQSRFSFRGFHLHTQHPNEWVWGFLGSEAQIGEDFIRWLARNNQNILQVKLLKTNRQWWPKTLAPLLSFARGMGMTVGLDLSLFSIQQKSFRLFDVNYLLLFLSSLTGWFSEDILRSSLDMLNQSFSFDYISMEIGTSEFTSSDYKKTLDWIEFLRKILNKYEKKLFLKIHVSSGQESEEYGNYNFLPQFSHKDIGVLPHTVMFYGLDETFEPIYGRTDFSDIKNFAIKQCKKRPIWFFPETSYWVAIDIDIPLFLSDYLLVRSKDMDIIEKHGIRGHVNFSSGQEMAYWLIDWTTALLSFDEYRKEADIGLRLLGEDLKSWKKILNFQNKFIKKGGLLALLSSANLMDELPFLEKEHRVHHRNTMKELSQNKELLRNEIEQLRKALDNLPQIEFIKNEEIRILIKVTHLRIQHAFFIRRALLKKLNSVSQWKHDIEKAKELRQQALKAMRVIVQDYNRYPEAGLFIQGPNPTSYKYGYLWTAATLHFWEREEEIIRLGKSSPFFMNIWDMSEILF